MPVPLPFRSWLLPLAAGLATACGSAPSLPRAVALAEGDKVAVHMVQAKNQLTLTLYNGSAVAAEDGNRQVGAKVVADADMQALLDIFAEKGLFERGLPQPPPQALDLLCVDAGGKRWHWGRTQLGVQAAEANYYEARSYFLALYNSSEAFHDGAAFRQQMGERPNFEDQRGRAARSSAAARNKLEQLRQGQR
jgi:hypothetical protein